MFGLGGVYVELFKDVGFGVAPMTIDQARGMIESTKAGRLLQGYRGGPVYDIDAVVEAIGRLSQLALDHPRISEAEINPLLNTVARFLNMHGQTGMKKEQFSIVVIMHGAGAKNALNEEAYLKKFGRTNPNAELLKALDSVGVNLYICGQSFYSRGFSPADLAEPVKLSLSAMTALVHFQKEGYQLINFN